MKQRRMMFPWLAGLLLGLALPVMAMSGARGETSPNRPVTLQSGWWIVDYFICVLNTTSAGQPWGVAMSQCLPETADRIPVAPVATMPSPGASRHPLP